MAFIGSTSAIDNSKANTRLSDVDCDSGVNVGDWVYMDSFGVAQKAIATSLLTSNCIGVVEQKISSTKCVIRFLGLSEGIFAGLDTAYEYFLSETVAGAMTTTPPVLSGSFNLRLGQPYSATRFLVLKGIRIQKA